MSIEMARPIRLLAEGKRGVRAQFGALCWRRKNDKVEVMLVTTRQTRRWVIPKGWPMDGKTPAQTAAIEAFEEAGVKGQSRETCIGLFTYLKEFEDNDLPVAVAVYPVKVTKILSDWPEKAERARRWLRPKKAAKLVCEPELAAILRNFEPPGEA
ncbi:NUDIX hydrolase [Palleronia sediminis]|uniref:NUDIX hydrolase n=2 Tax=Palleronia sediminis TaxID=2547833 RepID=A0A4V3B9K7_9RHOB|nr:NUDIX hydrolase [Palleronia sediminis]